MSRQAIHAPEFSDRLQWINTAQPLRLAQLRGRVVLLDFWTSCCINCQHVLADIHYLQRRFGERLVVLGIHSPKFPGEHDRQRLQQVLQRWGVHHPVATDPELSLWKQWGVRAWPTLILVDQAGMVVGMVSGEGHRERLAGLIDELLAAPATGGANPALPMLEASEPRRSLRFPGRVLAMGQRLYIADSGHHRVIEATPEGRVRRVFGSGAPSLVDGSAEGASFNDPQGLFRAGDTLYVADRGNHAVRAIDLGTGDIATVAGTGEKARTGSGPGTGVRATDCALNSPWDLVVVENTLFIAMAGDHRIWAMDLLQQTLAPRIGSGREDLVDGPAGSACLAQPTGLAIMGRELYVLDAESSALRRVRLDYESVSTLLGQGLFEFGDRDGAREQALLQHPQGLAIDTDAGRVWIADTYNNRIRYLDLESGMVGGIDLDHPLSEPGGLGWNGTHLFVANTHAHEILRVDVSNGTVVVLDTDLD